MYKFIIGALAIIWQKTEKGTNVHRIFFPKERVRVEELVQRDFPGAKSLSCPTVDKLGEQIQSFLKGEPINFTLDVIVLKKCTESQKKVLTADYKIPRGWVSTYGRIAKHMGKKHARGARNVGTALSRNPFPIIFPCHRVIKSDGSLGDYQGGVEMKRALLKMESVEFLPNGKVLMNRVFYESRFKT